MSVSQVSIIPPAPPPLCLPFILHPWVHKIFLSLSLSHHERAEGIYCITRCWKPNENLPAGSTLARKFSSAYCTIVPKEDCVSSKHHSKLARIRALCLSRAFCYSARLLVSRFHFGCHCQRDSAKKGRVPTSDVADSNEFNSIPDPSAPFG